MKNKLAERIISKIKKEKVKPISHWKFILKDSIFWGAFVISILIGGMTISIILNTLLNNDWDLYMQLSGGLSKFIVITLPYFWLVFLGIFVVIAYLNVHSTKKAYKHSLKVILGGVILMSFLLGLTFYNLGMASSFDKGLIQRLPPRFHQMVDPRLGVWQKPEGGFLIGEIQSLNGEIIELKDFEEELWRVSLNSELMESFSKFLPQLNKKVKIMGELDLERCEKCFSAIIIRPLGMERGMMKKQLDNKDLPGMMRMRKEINF